MQIHIDFYLHALKNIHIHMFIRICICTHIYIYITHINTCILRWNGSVSMGMCTHLSTPFSSSITRSLEHSIVPSCPLSWPVSLLSRSPSHPLFLTPALPHTRSLLLSFACSSAFSHTLTYSLSLALDLSCRREQCVAA